MLLKVGDLSTDAHCAEGGFPTDVRVRGGQDCFDFGEEVSCHLDRCNVAKSTQREADDVLVVVVEVTVRVLENTRDCKDHRSLLFQGISDESQDLLILVKEKHCAQVAKTFICKPRRSQQLETLDLAKMGSFPQSEEVE